MCDIHIDEITRASLCSRPGRISGHWRAKYILIQAVVWCPLVVIVSFGLNFYEYNFVYFGTLQNSSGNTFWLIVSHFVGQIGMLSLGARDSTISLGEKSLNPFSFTLLLEMLSDMALPLLSFWSFTLALLQTMERETIFYVYICVFI